ELLRTKPVRPSGERLLPAILAPLAGGGRQARRAGGRTGSSGRGDGEGARGGASHRYDPGGVGLPRLLPRLSRRPGAGGPAPAARGRDQELPLVDLREPGRPQAALRKQGRL
ncbi:MAG: hypothetical protein AVDCRST_MAG05-2977, partial [uncultured Rubrobacteraceae bacterium]